MMLRAAVTSLLLLAAAPAAAEPDLSRPQQIGRLQVFPDHESGGRFYYAPGDLELARDLRGRPDLHFLQMRYVGTAAYGNQGDSGSYSTLTLRVRLDPPSLAELGIVRRALQKLVRRDRVELRPLPITRLEAILVYAPVEGTSEPGVLDEGYFESGGSGGRTNQHAFWKERVFTIPMNQHTSQLLWALLHRQEVALSIAYVFFTRGVHTGELPEVAVTANDAEFEKAMVEELRAAGVPMARREPEGLLARLLAKLGALPDAGEDDPELELRTRMIHAGATGIRVNARRWPELFRRVDFNEEAPPGYAALKIYCYDFADALRPDLLYKKVEVEAESIGGRMIPVEAKFLFSQPDLYAHTVRFPVAVFVDRPFRYRVTAATRNGKKDVGPWVEQQTWGRILDITSRPAPAGSEATENQG